MRRNARYAHPMTKLLDHAVKVAGTLPDDVQDEIARLMLALAGDDKEPEPVDPDHLDAVLEGLEQARAGKFASRAEVARTLSRFGE